MVKKLSCNSCGSLKRFPHTFTTVSTSGLSMVQKKGVLAFCSYITQIDQTVPAIMTLVIRHYSN